MSLIFLFCLIKEQEKHIKEQVENLEVYVVGSMAESYNKAVDGKTPYDVDIIINGDFKMKNRDFQKQIESNGRVLLHPHQTDLNVRGTEFGIHVHQEGLDYSEPHQKL